MALGIGILLGISMGDSTLAFNQIAVIEELEGKVQDYRQKYEEISILVDGLQYELAQWEYLKDKYLQPLFKDTLHQSSVTLITGDYYPVELIKFLEESGCSYRAFLLGATKQWKDKPSADFFLQRDDLEVEKKAVSSYGQILWEVVQDREENVKKHMLMLLQGQGLLEVKKFAPAVFAQGNNEAVKEQKNVFLLTGDVPFVISVLQQGIVFADNNFIWIAVNPEMDMPNLLNKRHGLPGQWYTIEDGDTYFGRIKLWELLYELQQ